VSFQLTGRKSYRHAASLEWAKAAFRAEYERLACVLGVYHIDDGADAHRPSSSSAAWPPFKGSRPA
jgi:hypothetical protein